MLFSFISSYLKHKQDQRFHEGFDFAAGALLKGSYTPEQLADMASHPDTNSFDKGVLSATRKWNAAQGKATSIAADDLIEFNHWFLSEQGKPYEMMYAFARAAWNARAAKAKGGEA